MKKVEEYLKEVNAFTTRKELYEIGKQIQLDAIEAAVLLCAENADLEYTGVSGQEYWNVDKQTILNCADILKKEMSL